MLIFIKNKFYQLIFMPEIVVENQHCCKTPVVNTVSQREHFNYLRNNSSDIFGAMTWGNQQVTISNQSNQRNNRGRSSNMQNQQQYSNRGQQKKVTFNQQTRDTFKGRGTSSGKQKSPSKNVLHETNKRPKSAVRKSTIQRNTEEQEQKREQNKTKVQNYIAQLKPFSRNLTNTKFQQYFGKAAPECYGRANINEPIGGIIYGNHLKTFNMNPHSFTNKPQHYQTHTTAINYGKRTKLNQQGKWRRLEKQLTKKLGLDDKNETVKQGKQVVYVDVDDNNMYDVMRQNHEFQKEHRQEIRQLERQYKKDKHQQHLDDIDEFYAKKQDAIADQAERKNQKLAERQSSQFDEARLNQQVIYRHHDQKGNVRYGADRHALTCFVDLNFPENDSVYTEQLKSRMPISPTKVKNKDKNIDEIRKDNYFKSKEQVYPSHYLLRNCQQPEVLKMLSEKAGVRVAGNKVSNSKQARMTAKNPRTNKTFMSTAQSTKNPQESSFQNEGDFVRNEEERNLTKSAIMNRAWENSQVAEQIGSTMNQTCCMNEHLPHNEKNPRCYRNVSEKMGRIPFAG